MAPRTDLQPGDKFIGTKQTFETDSNTLLKTEQAKAGVPPWPMFV